MTYQFDYLVIGAGSGGVRSARIAAGHGAKAGIIEAGPLGGTCVNIGCVPKKLMAYASDFGPAFEDSKGFGWSVSQQVFDWNALIQNKNTEIERLNGIYDTLLSNAGVKLIKGFARFEDSHTVSVNGQNYTAEKFLIATGGVPAKLSIPGGEYAKTSDDMFYLPRQPDHIVIYGGGYIAVEFAHIFHGMGSKVSLVYRGHTLLKNFDHDIGKSLMAEMEKQGIDLYLETTIESLSKESNGATSVSLSNGQVLTANEVLSAIGRIPNTEQLQLDKAGIETEAKGRIIINEDYQTSTDNIYAVGDVAGQYHLTPIAIKEGHVLADRLFGGKTNIDVDYSHIPTAVFSSPPIGTVGLSEQEAREQNFDIAVYKADFKPLQHTLSGRDERTMMKLIVDTTTDRVIGLHMIGPDCPEMLQGFAVAFSAGATKADFDRTIPIHPTSAEEFVTLREPQKS